ncbi:uncharacterized protein [Anabrus simplex]|uniref:uncharacterized protein n=1 Tax=Anabrus simplex TaxID=316456 RepID=UPI0035A26B94
MTRYEVASVNWKDKYYGARAADLAAGERLSPAKACQTRPSRKNSRIQPLEEEFRSKKVKGDLAYIQAHFVRVSTINEDVGNKEVSTADISQVRRKPERRFGSSFRGPRKAVSTKLFFKLLRFLKERLQHNSNERSRAAQTGQSGVTRTALNYKIIDLIYSRTVSVKTQITYRLRCTGVKMGGLRISYSQTEGPAGVAIGGGWARMLSVIQEVS